MEGRIKFGLIVIDKTNELMYKLSNSFDISEG